MIEGKQVVEEGQDMLYNYISQIIKDARVESYRKHKDKGTCKGFLKDNFIVNQSTD